MEECEGRDKTVKNETGDQLMCVLAGETPKVCQVLKAYVLIYMTPKVTTC